MFEVPDQTGKVVLVTGGNNGLGKETCKVLVSKGAKVYMGARSREKASEAINDIKTQTGKEDIHWLPLDLANLQSVKEAADTFLRQERELHILYNNAGIMATPYAVTADGYEAQFGTNTVGHYALTRLLLPILESTAANYPKGTVRVVNVSSSGHGWAPTGGIIFDDLHLLNKSYWNVEWQRYGQSKLGNILLTQEIVKRYSDKGIYSLSLHPGGVSTGLQAPAVINHSRVGRFFSAIIEKLLVPVEQGAITQLYAGTSEEVITKELNGKYLVPTAKVGCPTKYATDLELADKMWNFLEVEVSKKIPLETQPQPIAN
eukprot:TRINITY_DN7334_c0_g1_i2.p1 TRINITY_DN7334_c0_g1~~TRINITY_DN7334_c0_g1_i2.p1  ORF type:complete len:317 (-),score=72.68 TRINITY_DN7334_c0_g1_i2:171-1121(-)